MLHSLFLFAQHLWVMVMVIRYELHLVPTWYFVRRAMRSMPLDLLRRAVCVEYGIHGAVRAAAGALKDAIVVLRVVPRLEKIGSGGGVLPVVAVGRTA